MRDAADAAQFWIGIPLVEPQALSETDLLLRLEADPHVDPRCGRCHKPCGLIHDHCVRRVRERNLFDRQVFLEVPLRRVTCLRCGVSTEHVVYDLFHIIAKFGREVIDRVRVHQANTLKADTPARHVIKR